VDGNAVYKDFPNCICRNKIVIEIADPENCYMLPSNPKAERFDSAISGPEAPPLGRTPGGFLRQI